jgi:hypothetical protein
MKVFPALSCAILAGWPVASPAATEPAGTTEIAALQVAAGQGLDNFIALASGRPAPSMPSRWHIEKVAGADRRPAEEAASALGRTLAQRAAEAAPKMQALPPGDELLRQTASLCDLADWCAMTPGYGNVLLAQRARDLAAVGVARLAADLDFPLEKIFPLALRLRPAGPGAAERQRILNQEAGADIFRMADQGDLEATWAAGARLLTESRPPDLRRGGGEMPLLRANLAFFSDEPPGPDEPVTLTAMWTRKWHKQLVDGLESRSAAQAVAIVEFRRVTGRFPLQLMAASSAPDRATTSALSAARGFPLVLPEQSTPLGQRAFEQAWQLSQGTAAAPRSGLRGRQAHVPVLAWAAFEAVRQGVFLDHDTASERYRNKP